jgi:hypothetical protein
MKNIWAKTVDRDHAYMITKEGDWTWFVLKAYRSRKSEKTDRYARWLCCVVTPMTGPNGDIGDTYIHDVVIDKNAEVVLKTREMKEEMG